MPAITAATSWRLRPALQLRGMSMDEAAFGEPEPVCRGMGNPRP